MSEPAQHDHRQRHCPMLGHEISFSYCRAPAAQLPCRKVFDCWWEQFDIVNFIKEHFSRQQVDQILAPRKDRLATIVGLIQQAQQNNGPTPGKP